eukprot:6099042-Prymnesium_polylepis.1
MMYPEHEGTPRACAPSMGATSMCPDPRARGCTTTDDGAPKMGARFDRAAAFSSLPSMLSVLEP